MQERAYPLSFVNARVRRWCGHCKSLAPEWAAAAGKTRRLSPPVMLAKVEEAKDENADDSEGPSLAKAYSMEVMQTIKEVRQRTPRA